MKARPEGLEADERTLLHESIMRAVQRDEVMPSASQSLPRLKWAFAGAIAAAVLLGGWAIHRHQSMDMQPTAMLAAAPNSLDENPLSQLPDVWSFVAQTTTNSQAILPQSVQELVKDVRSTTDFLLVSLP